MTIIGPTHIYLDITLWSPVILGIISMIALAIWGDRLVTVVKAAAVGVNVFLLALLLFSFFDFKEEYLDKTDLTIGSYAFQNEIEWLSVVNSSYHVGVDGLSYPLVILTVLIFLVSLLYSWNTKENAGNMFAIFLLLESGIIGAFISLDLVMFYVAWELVLVPMWLIILKWGDPRRRRYAAYKLLIYTHLFSLFMLIGFMYLYVRSPSNTFNIVTITEELRQEVPASYQFIFVLLLLGFAVKFPVVPFHTWLPDAHVEAPTPGSSILAGLLLKMGTYGLIRFALAIFAESFYLGDMQWIRYTMAIIGTVGITYSAFIALRQDDLKKMIAYSSVGHMGMVMLAYAAFTELAITGALYMTIAHGVISPFLFLLSGSVQHIAGTRKISELRGIGKKAQITGALMVVGIFASAGLPLLPGFIAELLGFIGVFQAGDIGTSIWFWLAMIGVISIIIVAAYHVWAIQRVVLGEPSPAVEEGHGDDFTELTPLIGLGLVMVLLGVLPFILLQFLEKYVEVLFSFK